MYVRRNLSRGYTRKELNVSFLRGQRLKLENKKDEYIQKWEDTSKDVIGTFLRMFGQREWNFEDFWNNSRRRITQALSPSNSREGSPEPSDGNEELDRDEIFVNEEPSPKKPRA